MSTWNKAEDLVFPEVVEDDCKKFKEAITALIDEVNRQKEEISLLRDKLMHEWTKDLPF